MKAILRNLSNGLYFKGGSAWTDDSSDALAYHNIEAALDAAYSSSMTGLELNLLFFEDPRFTVRVALDEFFFDRPHWSQKNVPSRKDFWFLNQVSCGRERSMII